MTVTYLLDTNVISEPLRPVPAPQVLAKLQQHASGLAIASVVWHELWYGCYRLAPSSKRTAIETYLRQVVALSMTILPYDEPAAAWHAGRTCPAYRTRQASTICRWANRRDRCHQRPPLGHLQCFGLRAI